MFMKIENMEEIIIRDKKLRPFDNFLFQVIGIEMMAYKYVGFIKEKKVHILEKIPEMIPIYAGNDLLYNEFFDNKIEALEYIIKNAENIKVDVEDAIEALTQLRHEYEQEPGGYNSFAALMSYKYREPHEN